MTSSRLLEVLRRETREQHAALERTAPMIALLRNDVSLDIYRQVLAAMRTLYVPLERRLLPALETMQLRYGPLPYRYAARVPLIDRDLEICGILQAQSSCSGPFPAMTAEEAIGVLYVLEGSTHGGRVIAPHIRQNLGLDAGSGLDLFSLYHHHKGWAGYCSWLANVRLESVSAPVEAACLVFEALSIRLQTLSVGVEDE